MKSVSGVLFSPRRICFFEFGLLVGLYVFGVDVEKSLVFSNAQQLPHRLLPKQEQRL